MPARNYKAQFGFTIKIYSVQIFILNNSAIWLVHKISPITTCNPGGYTVKISRWYHGLLIYDVKRTAKIDGMGPFKHADVHYKKVI